jgi:hypothetical protein
MLVKFLYLGSGIVIVGVLALQILRWFDLRREKLAWSNLAIGAAEQPRYFDPSMVSNLPDPARRYFLFSISPGTQLREAAELVMGGELSLGTKEKPNYMQMQARQILAAARGFVWRVSVGSGKVWISGSDGYAGGEGWTRFWLYNLLPVVRAGGGKDYARSAAGRSLAESLFWLPATLLPSKEVRWEPVNAHTARAVVSHQGGQHILELKVAPNGRPLSIWMMRWSRENQQRKWQLQPFGGTIEDIREQDGYRVAGSVKGGNWFGTDRYFPFYKARLISIRFF